MSARSSFGTGRSSASRTRRPWCAAVYCSPLESVVEGGWPLDRSSYDTAETRSGCLQCGDLGVVLQHRVVMHGDQPAPMRHCA
jgi:hypothetical protein